MNRNISTYLAAAALAASATGAGAASLQVAPLMLEVAPGGQASTITLRNEGPRPINAQVRVFRWTQSDGEDVLEPTAAVVASPPNAALGSRADYTVRVVRTARAPAGQEEAYRLIVDELPDADREKNGAVAMVLRHSVPVFFTPDQPEPPQLQWSVEVQGGQVNVTATNAGGRRVRLSKLKLTSGKSTVSFGDGLVGYALAGSSATWSRPARGLSGTVTISAQGDLGPINATARVQGR
jgi:fimbrial chaperone protein